MVMMTLTCEFNYRKKSDVVQGTEMKVFHTALLSKPWKWLPEDISLPPVGISVQILPL